MRRSAAYCSNVERMIRGTIAGNAEVLVGMDVIGHGDFAGGCRQSSCVGHCLLPGSGADRGDQTLVRKGQHGITV